MLNNLENIESDQISSDFIKPSRREAENAVRILLRWIGEDLEREGIVETPARFVKAFEEMFSGYNSDPAQSLGCTFEEVGGYDDMVLVKDIALYSHCEHHIVPIVGKAHVAYLPDGKVLGLSKIARVVDIFARRLQTQEKMTAQIAMAIQDFLNPRGVAIMIEAEHMCMAMRGVRKQEVTTTTTFYTGIFRENTKEQNTFLKHLNLDRD